MIKIAVVTDQKPTWLSLLITPNQSWSTKIQVNLCQKHLFLDQVTQNDKWLLIDLPVQYMKTSSSEHGENMLCAKIVLNAKTKKNIWVPIIFSPCSELVVFMYWAGKLMDNLLSYCGLVVAKKSFWQRFTCTEPTRSFKGEPRVDRTYHLEPNKVRYIIKVYSYIFKYFGYFIFSYYIRPLCDQNWTKICGK